jgi:hypothetical protein
MSSSSSDGTVLHCTVTSKIWNSVPLLLCFLAVTGDNMTIVGTIDSSLLSCSDVFDALVKQAGRLLRPWHVGAGAGFDAGL